MTTKEIAKQIRTDLKSMKGYKFSVRSESFSGGSSISVNVMKSPTRLIRTMGEVPETVNVYNYTRSQITEMQGNKYHQLSSYQLNDEYDVAAWCNGVFLTKDGHNDLMKVNSIIEKYHWDKSDPAVDHYDTNFYFNISLGKWDKEFIDGNN